MHKTYYLITQCFTFFFLSSAQFTLLLVAQHSHTHTRLCIILHARDLCLLRCFLPNANVRRCRRMRLKPANSLSEYVREKYWRYFIYYDTVRLILTSPAILIKYLVYYNIIAQHNNHGCTSWVNNARVDRRIEYYSYLEKGKI